MRIIPTLVISKVLLPQFDIMASFVDIYTLFCDILLACQYATVIMEYNLTFYSVCQFFPVFSGCCSNRPNVDMKQKNLISRSSSQQSDDDIPQLNNKL
jgi:hypothetical protein